jgi:hypothetical protein
MTVRTVAVGALTRLTPQTLALTERQQDVRIPGAVESQRLVLDTVAAAQAIRAEWIPSNSQGNSPRPLRATGARITTGAPLVPRWVRASVRK